MEVAAAAEAIRALHKFKSLQHCSSSSSKHNMCRVSGAALRAKGED